MSLTRRDALKATGTALAAGTAGCTGLSLHGGGEWPQAGYDAGHTGYNPRAFGPSQGDYEAWETRALNWDGSEPGYVPGGTPAVSEDLVVVPTNWWLYGLDRETGEKRWSHETAASSDTTCTAVTPAIADGAVVSADCRGVWGLDAASGEVLWRHELAYASRPTVRDRTAFVTADGAVRAYDLQTGGVRWRASPVASPDGAVAVADGVVYAGSGTPVDSTASASALGAADGREKWTTDLGQGRTCTPAVTDGTFFIAHRRGGGDRVVALDAENGDRVWAVGVGERGAVAAVAEGVVFVTGADGVLALDADTGEEEWARPFDATPNPAVAVTDSTVYVPTLTFTSGALYALARDDGRVRWSRGGFESRLTSGVAVAGDAAYLATNHGRMLALTD